VKVNTGLYCCEQVKNQWSHTSTYGMRRDNSTFVAVVPLGFKNVIKFSTISSRSSLNTISGYRNLQIPWLPMSGREGACVLFVGTLNRKS